MPFDAFETVRHFEAQALAYVTCAECPARGFAPAEFADRFVCPSCRRRKEAEAARDRRTTEVTR